MRTYSIGAINRGKKRIISYSYADKEQPIYRMTLRSKRLIVIARPTRAILLKHTKYMFSQPSVKHSIKIRRDIAPRVYCLKKPSDYNIMT